MRGEGKASCPPKLDNSDGGVRDRNGPELKRDPGGWWAMQLVTRGEMDVGRVDGRGGGLGYGGCWAKTANRCCQLDYCTLCMLTRPFWHSTKRSIVAGYRGVGGVKVGECSAVISCSTRGSCFHPLTQRRPVHSLQADQTSAWEDGGAHLPSFEVAGGYLHVKNARVDAVGAWCGGG